MHNIFFELSAVIALTVIVGWFMKLIKQPLILGYIVAGLLVGPVALNMISHVELFETFSSIGIALLMFIIGLGFNVTELRKLGKSIIAVVLATLIGLGILGFATASAFGMGATEALIIALTLFFSSTIVIVKILSDKKEQNRLHGQITFGVILVEHIVATIVLLVIATQKHGGLESSEMGLLLLKGIGLVVFLVVANTRLLPRMARSLASSQELLFLFALAWGFGIASLFEAAGFSLEEGALFAGVSLASIPYAKEIGARLKPLRDFFVVLFFIAIGQSLDMSGLRAAILPALALSAVVVIFKPLIVTTSLGLLGYSRRVSFKAGLNLSQISEFSIILVMIATGAGIVGEELAAIVALVAALTIATSAYLMHYDDALYKVFEKSKIKLFERHTTRKEQRRTSYQLILFGFQKGGHEFINTFEQMGKRYLVVDYDPTVVENLEHRNIPTLYGDANDPELLEEANVENAKLIVSTFNDFSVATQLVESVRRINEKAVIVCHADSHEEADELYRLGATYVMTPHYIGSEKVSSFIKKNGLDKAMFENYRKKHMSYLRMNFGSPKLGKTALAGASPA